jgi:predicted homoserine dehydrogenase-like protein
MMNLYTLLQQREKDENPIKVGVIGAGKFSSMFLSQARLMPGIQVSCIAELDAEKAVAACVKTGWSKSILTTANSAGAINDAAAKKQVAITEDSEALIASDLDVVVELTGVPEAGTRHACKSLEAGKHIIMVNVETDCLLGPALRKKADKAGLVYSMAYGDQPALIAEQLDWANAIGLEVVCAGKGTRYQPEYNYSTPETVWDHFGFTQEQVASGDYNAQMFNSFLDGTKSAIEMCAVANGSDLVPQKNGLQFPPVGVDELSDILKPKSAGGILEHSGTVEVIASEHRDGKPVEGDLRWGVYVVFKAPTPYVKRCFAEYGLHTDSSGEYASLYRPYHLIGLEVGISVASAALRHEPTGSAKEFTGDVACVAKKDLKPGDTLDGEGGYTVFGRLTRATDSLANSYFPMGLSGNAKVTRPVTKGEILTYEDVELNTDGHAYTVRKSMEEDARR